MSWSDEHETLEDMPLRRAALIGIFVLMVALCLVVVLITHVLS